jgi:hypothetical protein
VEAGLGAKSRRLTGLSEGIFRISKSGHDAIPRDNTPVRKATSCDKQQPQPACALLRKAQRQLLTFPARWKPAARDATSDRDTREDRALHTRRSVMPKPRGTATRRPKKCGCALLRTHIVPRLAKPGLASEALWTSCRKRATAFTERRMTFSRFCRC